MGLIGQQTPSAQQGGTGAGNTGFAGDERAKFRALKTGEAAQRVNIANGIVAFTEKTTCLLDSGHLLALAENALLIIEEAVASLLPKD